MKYLLHAGIAVCAVASGLIAAAFAGQNDAIDAKLAVDPRFSVESSNRALISLVVQRAKERGYRVRTERVVVGQHEFIRIYCEK